MSWKEWSAMAASTLNAHAVLSAVATPDVTAMQRAGYADVADGRGFATNYDLLPEPSQRNYEMGRFMAWLVKAHGVLPDWQPGERAGAMLRRLLGEAAGLAVIQELNAYVARDARR